MQPKVKCIDESNLVVVVATAALVTQRVFVDALICTLIFSEQPQKHFKVMIIVCTDNAVIG